MRKILLLSAAAMTAVSAMADLTDVTPKAYNFDSGLELPFVNAYTDASWGTLAWNPASFFVTKHPELYKDGMILMVGPNVNGAWDSFLNGTKIVNLGGEIGNVLCFGGTNSTAQEALKARGVEVELPSYEKTPGYMIPLWHADPNVTDAQAGGVSRACRIQIVLNIYQNMPDGTSTHFQPYLQTGSNGTLEDNNTPTRAVYGTDFCYTWGEAEADDHRMNFTTANDDDLATYSTNDGDYFEGLGAEETGYVWNPNRWMVYEWDVPFMNKPEDPESLDSEAPIKIKMEMPELIGTTVFIKSVKFLMKDADETAIPELTRRKSWIYMDASTSAVESVLAEAKALEVVVNGSAVTVAEAADIYSVTGVKVATVAAGETVELGNGFYVAAAAGKSAKFAVK